MSRFRIEERRVERVEGEATFDNKLVSTLLGELILNAVTS